MMDAIRALQMMHVIMEYAVVLLEYEIMKNRIGQLVAEQFGQNSPQYEETFDLIEEFMKNLKDAAYIKFTESIAGFDIVRRGIIINIVESTVDDAYHAISDAIDTAILDDDNFFGKNSVDIRRTLVYVFELYNSRNKNDVESVIFKDDITNKLFSIINNDGRINELSIVIRNSIYTFADNISDDIAVVVAGVGGANANIVRVVRDFKLIG